MIISLVVAMDDNGVIGIDGKLPWRLSSDLKHFKEVTMGKPIIMGRKTFKPIVMGRKTHESIGRPLPGRENIILTRDKNYQAEGCTVLNSLDDLFLHCRYHEEVMITGGAELYKQFLPRAQLIYLTEIHTQITGDTFFPGYNADEWEEIARQDFKHDEKNDFDYSFVVLRRHGR